MPNQKCLHIRPIPLLDFVSQSQLVLYDDLLVFINISTASTVTLPPLVYRNKVIPCFCKLFCKIGVPTRIVTEPMNPLNNCSWLFSHLRIPIVKQLHWFFFVFEVRYLQIEHIYFREFNLSEIGVLFPKYQLLLSKRNAIGSDLNLLLSHCFSFSHSFD
jgi:hypothetical protein